ncbi:hypothetical protein [Nocardia sp. NBC_01329]|uniref:hypothetical protein n=1 Tax=Nocardia sp. NBC_01329 TaxID=2903594 RepID=UPI002E0F8F72|nr:hypothetical protein OG405_07580 [Nocardia sp. NBC_01329]
MKAVSTRTARSPVSMLDTDTDTGDGDGDGDGDAMSHLAEPAGDLRRQSGSAGYFAA